MPESPQDVPLDEENILCLRLEGAVDMRTVPGIRRALLGHVKKRGIREVRIDFSRVTHLDTSGIAMFVEIWRCLTQKGGVLRLCGLSGNAWRLMRMARLEELFELREDPGMEV